MSNILFMGTPDLARDALEALYNKGHNIVGVVTNPDRLKGRGMKMVPSPVKEFALDKSLKIYQPEKIKGNEEFINEVRNMTLDFICVVAYGKILPNEIIEVPKYGAINSHYSLLPKYRGAAPINWPILNGDSKTGVTTMYISEELDAGDMILREEVDISEDETAGELWERLSKIGTKLLVKTLDMIIEGNAPRIKQPEEFTLAPMLDKQMSKIDWENKTASEIKNLVRGLNPMMGAYSYYNKMKIKFWKVNILSNEELISIFPELKEYEYRLNKIDSGTVLFSSDKIGLYIKAKEGIIEVLEIQGENARKMNINEYLRGNKIDVGNMFE